jgi:hypothetical protein
MSDKKALLHYKQHINPTYDRQALSDSYACLTSYYKMLTSLIGEICPDCHRTLEISHSYSMLSENILSAEKVFLTDDAFTAMLEYHCYPNVDVWHLPFNNVGFETFGQKEQHQLIVSDFGLNYSDLFDNMKYFMSLLQCGGYFIAVVPAWWFLRDNLNEGENEILQYAKKTDKQWIFQENLDFAAEDNGGKVERIARLDGTREFHRGEAAKLAGLMKLYNAECTGDISILETVTIPQSLNLTPAALVIQKQKKTLDKNNLFNI